MKGNTSRPSASTIFLTLARAKIDKAEGFIERCMNMAFRLAFSHAKYAIMAKVAQMDFRSNGISIKRPIRNCHMVADRDGERWYIQDFGRRRQSVVEWT